MLKEKVKWWGKRENKKEGLQNVEDDDMLTPSLFINI